MRLINADELLKNIPPEEMCSRVAVANAPTVEPEITETQVKEYCKKRCLVVLSSDVFYRLKSAQPERKWIPVTERLPEEDPPVLVTDGSVMWVCSLIKTDDGYKWEDCMGYWHDFDEWKAWMPLPKPYEEGKNERAN